MVLTEVGPQVDEWRELQKAVPIEAVVTLCPDPPGEDVQIRSDQWRVLTTIGNNGHTVKSVLDRIGGDQIVGLRTLRDLHTAHLVELDGPGDRAVDGARSYGTASGNWSGRRPARSTAPLTGRRSRLHPGPVHRPPTVASRSVAWPKWR